MTKQILQSLKIFRLATDLSRFGLLELIDSPATKIYFLWGKLWQKNKEENISVKVKKFLKEEQDELKKIFVSESGYEYVDSFLPEKINDEQKISLSEVEALTILFRRLAYFYPRLRVALPVFIGRMDIATDKRLAASETEEYLQLSGSIDSALIYEVDWSKTDKNNLKIELPPQTKKGGSLNKESQKTLIKIWGELFFSANVLLWHWTDIVSNKKGEAGFLAPDNLIAIDNNVQNYAIAYLQNKRPPQKYLEYKFVMAYNQLKHLCPHTNIEEELLPYCHKRYEKNIKNEEKKEMFENMRQTGFGINAKTEIKLTPPARIKKLQSPKIYGNEREFRNSSPLLFLLLAAMIYALLKYF